MPDRTQVLSLEIEVGSDADVEEVDQATRQLQAELLELDVDSVELASAGDVPAGAKGIEAAVLGALIIQWISPTGLSNLGAVLSSWLDRDTSRSIELRMGEDVIKLSGTSPADQARLIELWIKHHGEH